MAREYDPTWAERFYDEYGDKEWDRLVSGPLALVQLHVHRHYLEKYVSPGSRVLEAGAGPGRFTEILAELGAKVVVGDISPVQLELNRKHAEELGFSGAVEDRLKLDICDLSAFGDRVFDAVVCYGGPLSYVFSSADKALAEMLRVLKDGGVILASVMSLWGSVHEFLDAVVVVPAPANRAVIASGDLAPETYPDTEHVCHLYRAGEFRDLLESAGAQVVEMSASNCLTAAWRERLEEIHADGAKWAQVLDMEIEASREPGCLDMGTHMIAVARK